MLELLSKPLVQRAGTDDCQQAQVAEPDLCTPCRQVSEYLPKLKVGNAPAFEELARAVLELDDTLMDAVCGDRCATWETEDCECLLNFGRSIGVPPSYQLALSDECVQPWGVVTLDDCDSLQVKDFCDVICSECVVVAIDCDQPADKLLYQKLLKLKSVYAQKPATRANLNAALADFYGSEAVVLGAKNGSIYWHLGRQATNAERSFMPFLYGFLPISDFTTMSYAEIL